MKNSSRSTPHEAMNFFRTSSTYSLLNDETGQVFKERFLKTHDVINVKEDDQLIVITVGETFDTNEFMWA